MHRRPKGLLLFQSKKQGRIKALFHNCGWQRGHTSHGAVYMSHVVCIQTHPDWLVLSCSFLCFCVLFFHTSHWQFHLFKVLPKERWRVSCYLVKWLSCTAPDHEHRRCYLIPQMPSHLVSPPTSLSAALSFVLSFSESAIECQSH